MPYLTVGKEKSNDIKIHYEDHGQGAPVVLIHGFPFSGAIWEKQEAALLAEDYRVITYDRRGFGQSSQPSIGYDYDTFAKDLDQLLTALNLRDVTLVGHSMGTGEITRYLGSFGSDRISRAVFISPIPPFLLKTNDNPTGVDQSVFDGIKKSIVRDRPAFFTEFFKNFYNLDQNAGKVSEERLRADFNLAVGASAIAVLKCVDAWLTDFRKDLPKIKTPSLIIQGDADRILPFNSTGPLFAKAIQARLVKIAGASHGIPWTHADQISQEILSFISEGTSAQAKKKTAERETRVDLH